MTDNNTAGVKFGQPVYVPLMPQKGSCEKQFVINNNKFERTPDCDSYVPELGGSLKAFALPSPQKIIKGLTIIPVVLETGKKILIGIFDIRDIWNNRTHPSDQQVEAMVLPDEVANAFLSSANMAEA